MNFSAEQPPDATHAEPVQYAQVDVSLLPPPAATHQPIKTAPEEEHVALHYADLDLNSTRQAPAADDVTEQSPYAYAAHTDVQRQPVKPASGDTPYAYASHGDVIIQENGKSNNAVNLSEMYAMPNKPSLKAKPDGTKSSANDVNKANMDVSTMPTHSPNNADLAEMYAVPNKPSLKQKSPATTAANRVDDVTATVDSQAADQVATPDVSCMYATPKKPSLKPKLSAKPKAIETVNDETVKMQENELYDTGK